MDNLLRDLREQKPYKVVLSNPAKKDQDFRKVVVQLQEVKGRKQYQVEKFTEKQAFHINIEETDLTNVLQELFGKDFLQLTAWTEEWEYQAKVTSKGKLLRNRRRNDQPVRLRQGNNRQKQYCIPEGTVVPPLVDMGVFTKDGKVVQSMYDKYRQINRYLELVEDVMKELPEGHLNIVDFGCGKSYLTFLLYYYLVEIKKRDVTITGLDLKKDVIEKCNATAKKYGYEQLLFRYGDIAEYQTDEPIDMVITLHACDTATDYALYHAINWGAKAIMSVPCCQHEVNKQMQGESLKLLSRYGILKDRTAAILTDSMRGNLLIYKGYKTQIVEFVDMEHSPKNILIRGIRGNISKEKREQAYAEVEEVVETFKIQPTLYRLMKEQSGKE